MQEEAAHVHVPSHKTGVENASKPVLLASYPGRVGTRLLFSLTSLFSLLMHTHTHHRPKMPTQMETTKVQEAWAGLLSSGTSLSTFLASLLSLE